MHQLGGPRPAAALQEWQSPPQPKRGPPRHCQGKFRGVRRSKIAQKSNFPLCEPEFVTADAAHDQLKCFFPIPIPIKSTPNPPESLTLLPSSSFFPTTFPLSFEFHHVQISVFGLAVPLSPPPPPALCVRARNPPSRVGAQLLVDRWTTA